MNKIIFFELNEVPQKIVDYYIAARPQSWLAKNHRTLKKFNTYSENTGQLNPWNTWPTVHRGVDSSVHEILDLNQNLAEQNKIHPPIWELLAKKSISSAVFGSLHSYPAPAYDGKFKFYVPDVFALSPECWPKKVETFQKINLNLSRKSARNVNKKLPKKAIIQLGLSSPTLGIKATTIKTIGKQLIEERKESWKNTRRRTMQAAISFDIFYKLLNKNKPAFVSFFTNHVAACLHRYWAAAFPTAYEINNYPTDWIKRYDQEILFALDFADNMFQKLAGFVDKNSEYKLIILSSMGQDAVKAQPINTQLYITNPQLFMSNFKMENDFTAIPAMLPQFNFKISLGAVAKFKSLASKTIINGKPLRYREHSSGHFSLEMGHINQSEIVMTICERIIDPNNSGLTNVKISDQSSTTADHVPEGIYFVYHPTFTPSKINETIVQTRTILPSLLKNYGIAAPDYTVKSSDFIL